MSTTIRFGLTSAELSLWISDTCSISKLVRGRGFQVQVAASFGIRSGSVTRALTYFGVSVSSFFSRSLPATGSSFATVFGRHMSSEESSPRASAGGTAAMTTEWKASSALRLKVAQGFASIPSASVSVDTRSAFLTNVVSYMLPTVSNLTAPAFPPASGSLFVTLIGSLLGSSAGSVASRIGVSASVSAIWHSDSSVFAKVRSGSGGFLSISLSTQGFRGTSSAAQSPLSFLTPSVQKINSVTLLPATGESSVLFSCRSLAFANYSPVVRIMFSSSYRSVWISDSAITVRSSAGVGLGLPVTVSLTRLQSSASFVYTFDQHALLPQGFNAPATGSTLVLVSGTGFGTNSMSLSSVRFGSSAVASTVWKADSSLLCRVVSGMRKDISMQVSFMKFSKNLSSSVSYNLPTVSNALFVLNTTSFNINLPSSGCLSVTFVGSSFASSEPSMSVRIRGSAGEATVWISDSSAVMKTSAGALNSQIYQVSIGIQSAVVAAFVCFDIPKLTSVSRGEIPRTGSSFLSLLGSSFGVISVSQKVSLMTACESSFWTSSSAIICKTSAGSEPSFVSIHVSSYSVASRISNGTLLVSYEQLQSLNNLTSSRLNTPRTGSSTVTMSGLGFGGFAHTAGIRMGASSGQASRWTSSSSAACKVPAVFFRQHFFSSCLSFQEILDIDRCIYLGSSTCY